MKKYIDAEGVARNINEALEVAIQNALGMINCEREDVTYELLERGKSGFLGLGGVWAKVRVYYEELVYRKAEDFLNGIFEIMEINARAEAKQPTEDSVEVKLEGEDMGLLIGKRGETLDALQYITGLAVNRETDKYVRVVVDYENYREKRKQALERLAKKIADKVIKNKRNMTLEPMAPHERRIIHASLQEYSGITTYSTGQDPNRRIVIAYKSADGKQARPNRTSSNRSGQGGRGGRRRRPSSEKNTEEK